MARVNHKKVKQMLDQNRSKITDRQFFTSRILAGHYEDMAIAQTRRYKYNRRIHMKLIWKPRSDETAVTNNRHILINAGHPLVTKKNRTREDRYEIVTGMFAHSLGMCCLRISPYNRPTIILWECINGIQNRRVYFFPMMQREKKHFGNMQKKNPEISKCFNQFLIMFVTSLRMVMLKVVCFHGFQESLDKILQLCEIKCLRICEL